MQERTSVGERRWRARAMLRLACAIAVMAAACQGEPESPQQTIGTQSSAVELHDRGQTFGFAFVPPAPLADGEELASLRDRLQRFSFPIQATGAILMPIRDAEGVPQMRAGTAVRATCGATLVSPSYVITAAHCVDSMTVFRPESDRVTLQMFRPTRKLADEHTWRPKTELRGVFPDYQHDGFGESDGYFVDDYPCRVVSRCQDPYNCPPGLSSVDIALLHCPDAPGERYGYLGVAQVDTPGSEVLVPWKHEVYDIPEAASSGADLFEHYVKYPAAGAYAENYHYLDRNQLLPLVSVPWPDGTPRKRRMSASGSVVWTDVLACHGTSGSGFLQRDAESGAWELLGPTVLGGSAITGLLCEHLPGLGSSPSPLPGGSHIAYGALSLTQAMLLAFPERLAECATQPEGHFSLGGRTACSRAQSTLTFAPRQAYRDFDPWNGRTVSLPQGQSTLGSVRVQGGTTYRIGVSAVPGSGCISGDDGHTVCPELTVYVGDTVVLHSPVQASAGKVSSLGARFTASVSGSQVVSLTALGASFELGELTIVPDAYDNGFDTAYQRAEAALVVATVDARAALPMRFSGDGEQGFLAVLHAGERLVLSRAVVHEPGKYAFELASTETSELRCGLLAQDGAVLAAQPCRAGDVSILEYSGPATATAAFIDGASTAGSELDRVRISLIEAGGSSHCTDHTLSGDESDVDCGGSCSACGDGQTCVVEADCQSLWCADGTCSCRATDCQQQGKTCGNIADGCGATLACGTCTAPQTCGGAGTANVCGCQAESDAGFCTRLGKTCGSVTGKDNCGVTRTVLSCGTCLLPNTCGGAGAPNVCACARESDAAFCARLGKNCGSVSASDNCGAARTVANCGSCAAPNTCGGGGTANLCGSTAPACLPRYAQNDCLTYIQGVRVSANGRNWLCSNGNCANCAGFASCAPGGSGCPWGVVWTDTGACR